MRDIRGIHIEVIYRAPQANYRSSPAYYIAFGPHGPRRPAPPDEGRKVLLLSSAVIAGAIAVFAFTRMFANPNRPRTMTKEWQEASEEYLKVRWPHQTTPCSTLGTFTNTPCHTGTRIGANYWIQGYVGTEQTGSQRSTSRRRRVNKSIEARSYQQYQNHLYYPFPGQHFLWYCSYAHQQVERDIRSTVASRCWVGHCHISLPVYRNLRGIFEFESEYMFIGYCILYSPIFAQKYIVQCCAISNLRTLLSNRCVINQRGTSNVMQLMK